MDTIGANIETKIKGMTTIQYGEVIVPIPIYEVTTLEERNSLIEAIQTAYGCTVGEIFCYVTDTDQTYKNIKGTWELHNE